MLSRRHIRSNFVLSSQPEMFTARGRMFMMQAVKDGPTGQVRFRECIGGKTTIGMFSDGVINVDNNTDNQVVVNFIIDNTRIQRYFTLQTGIRYRLEFEYFIGANTLKKVSYYTFDVVDGESGLCKFNEPIDGSYLFIYNEGLFYEATVSQVAPDISCVTGGASNVALIGHCTIVEEFYREKSERYRVDFQCADGSPKITFNSFTCRDNMVPTLISTPANYYYIDKSNNLFAAVCEQIYSDVDIERYSVGKQCGTVTNISRIQKARVGSLFAVKIGTDMVIYTCINATHRSYMLEDLSTHEVLMYDLDTGMLMQTKKQVFERIDGGGAECRYFPKNLPDGESVKVDKLTIL